jgi:glycosyltransferase involved in cell wall biosynthesis
MKYLKSNTNVGFALAIMSRDVHYKEVFDLGIPVHYLIRKTKKDISIFSKLYQLCKSYKPDILHCWDGMTAVYSSPVCKLLNIKLVNGMVIDTPQRKNILNKSYLRAKLTFPFSSVIVGNSNAGLSAYKAPKSKSICIYNGFNFERLNGMSINGSTETKFEKSGRYAVGMIASFSKYKDYKTYFQAAQLLLEKRRDIIFFAAGSNTDSAQVKDLVEDKYKDHFKLLGAISGIESLISTLDICVLSTFTEGISNSIMEYMALGKPVIATSGGGTNEIVLDNKTGFLVNRSDPQQLAEKIEILLNDAELRKRMGIAGKERVHELFPIHEMVNKYVSVYNKLYA